MHDAPAMQVVPEMIGVPRGARVAPVRVSRPEGEADAASERVTPRAQQPRDLEHRRVGGGVVHRAVMPGIDVTREEHEAILDASGQRGHQMRNRHPPGAHARGESHAQRTVRQVRPQPLAVVAENRQTRRGGDPPGRLGRRSAPDRGHDHVVQVIHDDEDLAERPGLLGGPRLARRREAAHEGDLAGGARELDRASVTDVDDLTFEGVHRR